MNDIKIVVASCDAYSDCWEPWNTLKERYWTKERAALITETARRDDLFDTIPIQAPTWTERMRAALEQIAEPFVVFMCDDHFIRRPVNQKEIIRCAQWMELIGEIAVFNFEKKYRANEPSGFSKRYERQRRGQIYNFSCQPSIWRREMLITCLHEINGSPWEWELTEEYTGFDFYINAGGHVIDVGYRKGSWMGIHAGRWVMADMQPLNDKEKLGIDFSQRGTC